MCLRRDDRGEQSPYSGGDGRDDGDGEARGQCGSGVGERAAADDGGFRAVRDAAGDGLGEGVREVGGCSGNGWGDAGAAIEVG